MHTIYKIHNNSNIFYTLLSIILRWYKQHRCTHDWRNKASGTIEHAYARTVERRCVKCKKKRV
jgi:hypothetical protein